MDANVEAGHPSPGDLVSSYYSTNLIMLHWASNEKRKLTPFLVMLTLSLSLIHVDCWTTPRLPLSFAGLTDCWRERGSSLLSKWIKRKWKWLLVSVCKHWCGSKPNTPRGIKKCGIFSRCLNGITTSCFCLFFLSAFRTLTTKHGAHNPVSYYANSPKRNVNNLRFVCWSTCVCWHVSREEIIQEPLGRSAPTWGLKKKNQMFTIEMGIENVEVLLQGGTRCSNGSS